MISLPVCGEICRPKAFFVLIRYVLSWGFLIRIGIFVSAGVCLLLAHGVSRFESREAVRSNVWLSTLSEVRQLPALLVLLFVLATVTLALIGLHGWPPDFDLVSSVSFIFLVIISGFLAIRDVVGRSLSLASNQPLQQTIKDNIDISALRACRPPVYCTMAMESTWWDPFEDSGWSNVSDGAKIHLRTSAYLSLGDAQSDDDALDWLLQTAALPEIFPRRPVQGDFAVDGASLTTFQFTLLRPTDLIRLSLSTLATKLPEAIFLSTEAARIWWMGEFRARADLITRQKANVVRQNSIAQHGPIHDQSPTLIPQEPRLLVADQFLPIIPRQGLGNSFIGPLSFGGRKARRLLMAGYRDGLIWIAENAERWKVERQ